MKGGKFWIISIVLVAVGVACHPKMKIGNLTEIPFAPRPYPLPALPYFFPELPIPADNPITIEGVDLGRYLFYDPILSRDKTIACAMCHQPFTAFTDGLAVSEGIDGRLTARNSMSLVNVGFFTNGLFWDGRVSTLEEQALHPIQDPNEMDNSLEEVETRLRNHPTYPERFRRAFGIQDSEEITIDMVAKALAQFQRTLISATSKFDYANWDRGAETNFFTASELRGQKLFTTEPIDPDDPHPGCSHCHNATALVTTNEYLNNGLDPAANLNDFADKGRGAIVGSILDNGKFRVPSLRNIELTAPYMHDGRFNTLEEVLEHYSSGGHYADNVDANIQPFPLSDQDKADLIAFMKTMTDTTFLNRKDITNPF